MPLLVKVAGEPSRLDIDHDHPRLAMISHAHRRLIERDAWLVLGHWPPAELDGRQLRHDRAAGAAPLAARSAPLTPELAELLELTRLEPELTLEQARRLSPDLRADMLYRARHQHRVDREALQQQLADTRAEFNREIPPG